MQNRRPVHRNNSPKPAASSPQAGEDEKEEGIEVMGKVVEKFRAGMFSIELEGGQTVLAAMAGKLRRNRIRIMNGDRVTLELSPYDLTRGRITYRHK
jgi:translation initiation factor IF-1